MSPFSVLVKPVSADCNLCCTYCYYLPVSDLYPGTVHHSMPESVLEHVIKSYMDTDQAVYQFYWQGGEPCLAGLDFFQKAVDFQKKYVRPGAVVSNAIQTNATLITDEWAAFFARYRFLVGCSLDGPKKMHNQYRLTRTEKPTQKAVCRGLDLLQRHRVPFNTLTVVSQANVDHPRAVYQFLKQAGAYHHQYIPCTAWDSQGRLQPYAITGRQWGRFLTGIFDAWYPKDTDAVCIGNFDAVLAAKMDGMHPVCSAAKSCNRHVVIEYNGDVYPCDFFVTPVHCLGNIMKNSWETLRKSGRYTAFLRRKADINAACSTCEFLPLCWGDCLRNRLYQNNDARTLSCLCPGLKTFLTYTREGFDQLCRVITSRRLHLRRPLPFTGNLEKPC